MTSEPASHGADSHDLIRVVGARVNNLRDVSIELPKRRLTVFTGVSGSGKSLLVFGTIAAESQRLINETYSAFVQGFMPTLARPEVDVLEGLTTAIIVSQERMGGDPRSTVGTATDANAMLRILFSRLGRPYVGSPQAFSFNVASISGAGAVTTERSGRTIKERRSFSIIGGMCPRCEGRGSVNDIDLTQLYDESLSLNQGALTVPGYSMEGWYGRIFIGCGYFDPDKPINKYTKKELDSLLYKAPTKIKVDGINLTYEGLIPRLRKSMLSKDVDSLQPHIRAFVERAVTFTVCPECEGTRLSAQSRSSRIRGTNIAEACAMQISDLADWVRELREPSMAPLLKALGETLDSFVEIGLGYLSLDRPSGTLSGGEAQRTKMIRHLGSSLTDVTYVFDEPTIGLHPHDIERMNQLLLRLRDKGNTVLVVEHKPEAIAIADHVVDLGPRAGSEGGEVVFEGTVEGLRGSGTITGRHLDDRAVLKEEVRAPGGALEVRGQGLRQGERRETGAVQRQLGGRVPQLQRDRSDLQRPRDDGRCCHDLRGLRGQAVPGRVLEYTLGGPQHGKNISEVLVMSVAEAEEFFDGAARLPAAHKILSRLTDVGLGYLALGQPLTTLSGGERQRIKLATQMGEKGEVYILDEPTSGLHLADVEQLLGLLDRLVDAGKSVIVIEHHQAVMAHADWIIDLGPGAGHDGGRVVFEGPASALVAGGSTLTGKHLAAYVSVSA